MPRPAIVQRPRETLLGLDYGFDTSELTGYLQRYPQKFRAPIRKRDSYRQVEPERFPTIAEALLTRGYSEERSRASWGHNNLRIARAVWR